MAWNIAGDNMGGSSSAGTSFISTIIAKMPYSYKILQNIETLNPKYEIFQDLAPARDDKLQKLSVARSERPDDLGGAIMINKDYHKFMYANIDLDKVRRLQEYRRMAGYAELNDCISEICDESIVKDEHDNIVTFRMRGGYEKSIAEEVKKEWDKFMTHFNLEEQGWNLFRNLLIDGELYFENIISENKPELGILGVMQIPTELINPVYDNIQNQLIKGYILRKIVGGPRRNMSRQDQEDLIPMEYNQVTYVNSGMWNEDKTIRLPLIENARRAYKQLSLIEDSIVIYRLVRAPERMVFKVDVGNMSPPKAEAYLRRLMMQFWSKRSYDTTTGRTINVYDPMSMLDAYWFAKRAGTEGTDVSVLPGGQNLGQLDDLMYFIKKLYKSLNVPIARLDPNDAFKDGSEITREELRFAKFIIRIQKQFAAGLKNGFITHLKLRGLWKQYGIQQHELCIDFNSPSNFMVMRDQQNIEMKFNNYSNITQNEGVAVSFAQRYYLGLSDEEMNENRQWRRHDAAFQFEIDQIRTSGPKWREQQAAAQGMGEEAALAGGGGGGLPGGGGSALPGGGSEGFTPKTPPDFGPAAPTGGAAPATAGAAQQKPTQASALPGKK